MSPASIDISASFTRNMFLGCMNMSRIVGLVTRKMLHEYTLGPLRIVRSNVARAFAASAG